MKITYSPIYPMLRDIGAIMQHNGADLYVVIDEDTRPIVDTAIGVTRMYRDGKQWAHIPLAYTPYWESRNA